MWDELKITMSDIDLMNDNKPDYPQKCYKRNFMAHDKEEDFKHNLLVHNTVDFCPILKKIKEEG
jgi:hypothetical protein